MTIFIYYYFIFIFFFNIFKAFFSVLVFFFCLCLESDMFKATSSERLPLLSGESNSYTSAERLSFDFIFYYVNIHFLLKEGVFANLDTFFMIWWIVNNKRFFVRIVSLLTLLFFFAQHWTSFSDGISRSVCKFGFSFFFRPDSSVEACSGRVRCIFRHLWKLGKI